MADDIRLSTALPHHPKLLKLKRRLGGGGCWALVELLCWVGDNRPDGNLAGLSDEDLELAIGWTGSENLLPVLALFGFLDGDPGSYSVHGWAEHQPFVATRGERVQRAREAAQARWAKTTPQDRAAVAQKLLDARAQKQSETTATCEQRATGTLGDVQPTYGPHVRNVPSTHALTPRTPPKSSRRTRKAASSDGMVSPSGGEENGTGIAHKSKKISAQASRVAAMLEADRH